MAQLTIKNLKVFLFKLQFISNHYSLTHLRRQSVLLGQQLIPGFSAHFMASSLLVTDDVLGWPLDKSSIAILEENLPTLQKL